MSTRPIARLMIAPRLSLTLYVAGDNVYSRIAQANLKSILAEMDLHVRFSTVDVLRHPELTMQKRIFVTPALIVSTDAGVESLIVGDFSNREKVTGMFRNLGSVSG